jgi:hypothetical protein
MAGKPWLTGSQGDRWPAWTFHVGDKTMLVLAWLLLVLSGIAGLVCFILVLIKMFQDNQTGLGVACIILVFCGGIGGLIAYIVGWINAKRWGITNVMIIWTVCWVIEIGAYIPIFFAMQQAASTIARPPNF